MRVLYAVPAAKRYRAMELETRQAAADGHEVHLAASFLPYWQNHEGDLDSRVTVHWLRSEPATRESTLVTWILIRVPRGLLRRMRRGPFRRPVGRVLRIWNRRVAGKLEKARKRRTARLRERNRRDQVMALIEDHRFDWLVLGEPGAIDLLADDLPGLLDRRPELRTTYSYEQFADKEATDVR